MRQKAMDAQRLLGDNNWAGAKLVNGYLKTDFQSLRKFWTNADFLEQDMGSLGRYIWFGDVYDYDDILARGLSQIEFRAETQVRSRSGMQSSIGFEELVHPVIVAHAFRHNVGGHYPGAGLNSIVAIFDLMRERIGLDLNGVALAMQALSLEIASPSTEVRTVYTKIRTRPNSLNHNLDPV